jgi:hypothetical protein
MTGEAIFMTIGCGDCHVPSFTTSPDDEDDDEDGELFASKLLKPYSDFLVHDMGFAADFIGDGSVGIQELRTPPLWGMRIRDPLWHDGRVAGGDLAFRITFPGGIIDQHNSEGSEAQPSAQAFLALSAADKDHVIAFLDSLGRREFDTDGDGDVDEADRASVEWCATTAQVVTPDHGCAVADVGQDGLVDADDLALLDVALGVDLGTDEDEDADEGPDGGDDEGTFPLELDASVPSEAEGEAMSTLDQNHGTQHDTAPSTSAEEAPLQGKGRGRLARPAHRGL